MFRFRNLSIAIKLTVISGIGILLVAAIIVTQMWGNANIESANELVVRRAGLTQHFLAAKAAMHEMQIAARDIGLAILPASLTAPNNSLATGKNPPKRTWTMPCSGEMVEHN